MKYKSHLLAQASGSVAGATYSHNRGGLYIRARSIPVNSSTTQQQAVRDKFAILAVRWSSILTSSQRLGWETYADAVQVTDTLGEKRKLTGMNWYIASNTLRLQASFAVLDTAPAILTLATLTAPAITSVTASTGVMVLTFTNTDLWATASLGALMVYTSQAQPLATNFFQGPYRFAGKIAGATTPPTSPQNINIAFPLIAAQQGFAQFRAFNSDGRISAPFRLPFLAV